MNQLTAIMEKFADSGWELIAVPAAEYLSGKYSPEALVAAIRKADAECGSCGCEFDPLYKRALELLQA